MSARSELVIRTAIVVLTALFVIGLARLLAQITEILIVVLIAAILATGIAPLATRLEQVGWGRRGLHLSRTWAILVVFLLLLVFLVVLSALVFTPLVLQVQAFVANLDVNIARLTALVQSWRARWPWLPDLSQQVQRLPAEINRFGRYFAPAAGVAVRFFGGVATVTTVMFLAFYMLVEGPAVKVGFLALFPKGHRRQVADVLERIGAKFGGWIRGQLLLGLIIGVAAGIGTAAVGIPFPMLLGLFAGITELIPMVGPLLGAIPAVFLALFQPVWKLIFVIAWYTLIQQSEANFVVPRVMRRAVGLSPLLTIIALVLGARLLGAVGALLAVPVAAALQVIVGELVRRFGPDD